jgi:ankyrin repeat protein
LCYAIVTFSTIKLQTVLLLLDQGHNPNEPTTDGYFPITLAAFWGHQAVVEALLERDADVNVQNRSNGWTALHAASLQGHAKIVFQLFDHNPQLNVVDHNGCTAGIGLSTFFGLETRLTVTGA